MKIYFSVGEADVSTSLLKVLECIAAFPDSLTPETTTSAGRTEV